MEGLVQGLVQPPTLATQALVLELAPTLDMAQAQDLAHAPTFERSMLS